MDSDGSKMDSEAMFSRVIDFLRFPLIAGVVLLHSATPLIVVGGQTVEIGASDLHVYRIISSFLSNVLGRLAVPLFFFISGYLFFYKTDFTRKIYGDKLKKRARSLLVPYLFWNVAMLSFYFVALSIPVVAAWFNGPEYTWSYVMQAMWGIPGQDGMTYPLAYQFWFIRDLIVIVLLTPAVYWIITKTKLYGVLFLGLLWYLQWFLPYVGSRGISPVVLFFFTLGAWFSVNRKNVIDVCNRVKWLAVFYIPVAIADVCTKGQPYNSYIHNIGILFGILFVFVVAAALLRKGWVRESAFLSSASFFVFAVHERWLLSQIKKISLGVFQPESNTMLTIVYLGNAIVVIAFSLAIYYLLKRFLPRFTAFITGGR